MKTGLSDRGIQTHSNGITQFPSRSQFEQLASENRFSQLSMEERLADGWVSRLSRRIH